MPYSDSDPYGRNLVLSSLFLIALYWGDGELIDPGLIRLPIVNLQFENLNFLFWMGWGIYFFILIRFAIQYGFLVNSKIREDIKDVIVQPFGADTVVNSELLYTGKTRQFEARVHQTDMVKIFDYVDYRLIDYQGHVEKRTWKAPSLAILSKIGKETGSNEEFKIGQIELRLKPRTHRELYWRAILKLAVSNNKIISQYFPYVLALFAMYQPATILVSRLM